MLKIKLTRTGKKGQPNYRIVVIEAKTRREGKYLESLGFYQPQQKPAIIKINQERYQFWLQKGAQPTPTVRKLAHQTRPK